MKEIVIFILGAIIGMITETVLIVLANDTVNRG